MFFLTVVDFNPPNQTRGEKGHLAEGPKPKNRRIASALQQSTETTVGMVGRKVFRPNFQGAPFWLGIKGGPKQKPPCFVFVGRRL